jgi:hypothetical protein
MDMAKPTQKVIVIEGKAWDRWMQRLAQSQMPQQAPRKEG